MKKEKILREEISTALKNIRIESDLTQAELASRLGYSTPQYVSNWERSVGASILPLYKVKDFARITGMDSKSRERLEKILCEYKMEVYMKKIRRS